MTKKQNLPELVPEVFEHEQFGSVRVVMIDGEPWFVAVDVCKILELGNTSQALKRLDDDERGSIILNEGTSPKGGSPVRSIVNEPGLYRLIFMSRKKIARDFQRWVYHEVLPSIRKTGTYTAPQKRIPSEVIELPDGSDGVVMSDEEFKRLAKHLDEKGIEWAIEIEKTENGERIPSIVTYSELTKRYHPVYTIVFD